MNWNIDLCVPIDVRLIVSEWWNKNKTNKYHSIATILIKYQNRRKRHKWYPKYTNTWPLTVLAWPLTVLAWPLTVLAWPLTVLAWPLTVLAWPLTVLAWPLTVHLTSHCPGLTSHCPLDLSLSWLDLSLSTWPLTVLAWCSGLVDFNAKWAICRLLMTITSYIREMTMMSAFY